MKSLQAIAITIIITALAVHWLTPYDSTDDKDNKKRSGLILFVDHGTGCHYIKGGLFGTMVPRVDADAKHICNGE